MTCRELIERIADELDDGMSADSEDHLAGCASCRAYLQSYRDTIALARAAMEEDDRPVILS